MAFLVDITQLFLLFTHNISHTNMKGRARDGHIAINCLTYDVTDTLVSFVLLVINKRDGHIGTICLTLQTYAGMDMLLLIVLCDRNMRRWTHWYNLSYLTEV